MTDDNLSGETVYSTDSLRDVRSAMELTQSDMATLMGLSFRAYQALEGRQNPIRRMHMLLAYSAAVEHLASHGTPEMMLALSESAIGIKLVGSPIILAKLAKQAGLPTPTR